ncbi:MAG: SDR family NAD(P)-dependent oxidoreductase, partial [Flavobacteriaceae bacterium]|nr:SDR family NAD(P)-dependent oxidoreductase [Flavobacteriaceae bacterium]
MAKNVIITGTSSGIGYELVKIFATKGHNVIALSRNILPINDLKLSNVYSINFDINNN